MTIWISQLFSLPTVTDFDFTVSSSVYSDPTGDALPVADPPQNQVFMNFAEPRMPGPIVDQEHDTQMGSAPSEAPVLDPLTGRYVTTPMVSKRALEGKYAHQLDNVKAARTSEDNGVRSIHGSSPTYSRPFRPMFRLLSSPNYIM